MSESLLREAMENYLGELKLCLHVFLNPRSTIRLRCSFSPDFHGFSVLRVCTRMHLQSASHSGCASQQPKTSHTNLLQNHAPPWWRSVLRGPALGPYMRKPGCNGGTCYCNQRDLCNEKAPYFNVLEDGSCPGCHQDEEKNGGEMKAISHLTALVAVTFLVI